MNRKIIIATRGSELALWQAHFVQSELKKINIESELLILKTQGDRIQHLSLDKLEGKGFFTKEIEEALLNKSADLAVHSHKDLPTESPEGLVVAAVSYREDPRELILIRKESYDRKKKFGYKKGATVGTSSARRKAQLLAFRPDTQLADLRGNVPTRIQKLRDGQYDAIMLASAGVERLNIDLSEFEVIQPDATEFVPAPAQGVLALQTRENDHELIAALQQLHHEEVQECIAVERKILNLFEGGCHMPLGAYCVKEEDTYKVWTAMADAAEAPLKIIYSETRQGEAVAEKIVQRLRSVKPASVFITRDLREEDVFKSILSRAGFDVSGKALIDTIRIPFGSVPECDWIFFSSKHAVKHFLSQTKLKAGIKIAAVGKGTSEELRKFNVRADFIGGGNDTRITAKQFAAVAGRARVLFPQAKGSIKTVQHQMPAAQVIDLVVYETINRSDETIEPSDIMVFTSPSNVEAYFVKNKLSKTHKVVAMGHATGNTLKEKGMITYALTDSFDEAGLVRAVMRLTTIEQ
ncbi:MAG: hypothetical protein Fur0041_03010 [Bacteroidia bacterium]